MQILAPIFLMASLQFYFPFVAAGPLPQYLHIARNETRQVPLGLSSTHRVAVVVICLVYAFLLALAQGYRAGRMANKKSRTSLSDILVFAQGFISTASVFVVGIYAAGLGLSTDTQCYAIIRICIAMYGAAKIALYLFLLERVYIVRAPFIERVRDPIYMIGFITTVGGFAALMGYQYISPKAELSREDGICRIGIQSNAAISIIALDTAINVALTIIFIWQLQPAMNSVATHSSGHVDVAMQQEKRNCILKILRRRKYAHDFSKATSKSNLRLMVMRNVIGSSLLLLYTIANNAIFLRWSFAKLSHACLLMCLTDVVLGMLITNWLTMRSADEEMDTNRSLCLTSHNSNSATSGLPTLRSRMQMAESFSQDAGVIRSIEEKPSRTSNVVYEI